jgi:hypothetical protein
MNKPNLKTSVPLELQINKSEVEAEARQQKKELVAKKELEDSLKKNSKAVPTSYEIERQKHKAVADETFDLIFELISTAIRLIDATSKGRTGLIHNMELLNLYTKVVTYRRKFLGKYAQVDNDDRLDLMQLKKDLIRTLNDEAVKMRSPRTKTKLKNFKA